MKQVFLLIVFCLTISFIPAPVNAAHYKGGEIRWECLPNGNFRFIMELYRECSGPEYPQPTLILKSDFYPLNTTLTIFPDTISGITDISPWCNPDTIFPHITCANAVQQYPLSGGVEKWVYTSDAAYPNGVPIPYVPPANGIMFYYEACCRAVSNNVQGSAASDFKLRAVMLPYKNQSLFPCYDHSPASAEPPEPFLCNGYPTSFYQHIEDKDSDSLSFSWAPLLVPGNPYYTSGYSYSSPFPGPVHNPNNQAAVMDPQTGEISLTSYTQGGFYMVQKLTSYREGIPIAEVYRENLMLMFPCGAANTPPSVSVNGGAIPSGQAFLHLNASPGDTMIFTLDAFDTIPQTLLNGDKQTLTMEAKGIQFGDQFQSETSGCPNPPCAILTPPLPLADTTSVFTTLYWRVTYDHFLSYPGPVWLEETHRDFTFRVQDDVCPLPGVQKLTLRVALSAQKPFQVPAKYCIKQDSNGIVTFTWDSITDTQGFFQSYYLYGSDSLTGSQYFIDSITSPLAASYTTSIPSGSSHPQYYRLIARFSVGNHLLEEEVFALPTMAVEHPDTVCADEPFTMIIKPYRTGFDSFYVDPGQASVLSIADSAFKLTFPTSGLQTFYVFQKNDCGINIQKREVYVRPGPIPGLIGTSYACPGQTVVLTATGGVSYQWSNGMGLPQIYLPPLTQSTPITLTVTDEHQCSSSATFLIQLVEPYENEEICAVTTDNQNGQNLVLWEPTNEAYIKAYHIRAASENNPQQWQQLGQVPFSQAGSFTDIIHNPLSGSYLYQIQVVDSCNNSSSYSSGIPSLHLSAGLSLDQKVYLEWNSIGNYASNNFFLYRSIDSGAFILVDSIPGTQHQYIDAGVPQGDLQYYLEVQDVPCDPGGQGVLQQVLSNIADALLTSIPNRLPANSWQLVADGREGFWLEGDVAAGQEARLMIMNSLGAVVYSEQLLLSSKKKHFLFPFLRTGIYYCHLRIGNKTDLSGKFIILRE